MKIGAQMFTVHDYCKDLQGLENSLKKIAEIGYKYVQVSGTCEYDPLWLKEKLQKYNLKCVLTHISPDKLINNTDEVINNHNVFDCKYIGLGGMPDLWDYNKPIEEVYQNFISKYTPVAEKFQANGKYFMYHNHNLEFVKDSQNKIIFDKLIENMPADIMGFTLDTYWLQYAGVSVTDYINKLKGRCPVVHFKDYKIKRTAEEQVIMAPCGEGNLDFKSIIKACKNAGAEYVMVEQDICYEENPFDCLKRSYDYLKSLGLE